MKVDYLFSRNEKIGSKLIAWGSSLFPDHTTMLNGNIPSHVAVLLNDTFVIEAVASQGVRIIPYTEWLKHNELLFEIPCRAKNTMETVQELLFEMYGKKYDWLGILFFTHAMIENYLFGTILPKTNKWEREDYFFCTEFAARLKGYNYSMTTPAKMCNDLLKVRKNNE